MNLIKRAKNNVCQFAIVRYGENSQSTGSRPRAASQDGKGWSNGNRRMDSMDLLFAHRDVPRGTRVMRQGRVTLLMSTEMKCSYPAGMALPVKTMMKCFGVLLRDDAPADSKKQD